MSTIEDGIEILAAELGAVCRQIEDNGPEVAEDWVAGEHDEVHTRQLLILSLIPYREVKQASTPVPRSPVLNGRS